MSVSAGERHSVDEPGVLADGEGCRQQLGADRGHGGCGERAERDEGETQPRPVRGRCRRGRARPGPRARSTTPTNHIPWLQAHTHVSGTSHQRARPSRRVASQAPVVTATRAKDTSCGRRDRLPLMPTRAATRTSGRDEQRGLAAHDHPQAQRDGGGAEGEQPRHAGQPEDLLRPAHEQLGQPLVQPPRLRRHRAPRVGPAERPRPAQVVAGREVPEGVGVAEPAGPCAGRRRATTRPGSAWRSEQGAGRTSGPRGRDGSVARPAGPATAVPRSRVSWSAWRGESPRVGRHRPIIPADSGRRGLLGGLAAVPAERRVARWPAPRRSRRARAVRGSGYPPTIRLAGPS